MRKVTVPEGRMTMFINPETTMPLLQPPVPSTPEPYADFVLGVDGIVTERKAGVISYS
jgi:hypothetical protein